MILIKLILAHLLGDFLLQPTSWVKQKEKKKAASPLLYLHALIHGALVFIFLWNWQLWYIAVAVFIIHLVIDLIKIYIQKETNATRWFIIDQILHLISLLIIYFIVSSNYNVLLEVINNSKSWTFLTALFFLTIPSGIIMKNLLTPWSQYFTDDKESLNNAGKYIGYLERLFIFLFILTNHWEAIGFLLAAKSVFRFGDLQNTHSRKLTEYILIGTLLSFAIAFATAILTKWALYQL